MYKSGFATSQEAYEKACKVVFESLDKVEKMLEGKDYLVGNTLTEVDVRLYTTIVRLCIHRCEVHCLTLQFAVQVRFDPVYHGHFKCNYRTIRGGYPNIHS